MQNKRLEEKKTFEAELTKLKEQYEFLKRSSETLIKEKDIELKNIKDHLLQIDKEGILSKNILSNQ
jgi:hypothetical protein